MTKRLSTLIVTAAALASMSAAHALQVPEASTHDGRIKYVSYCADDVVPIHAVPGMMTAITFEKGEVVENFGSGFSTAWEFATRDNHFYLKPREKQGTTNLIVMTNRRVYTFDVKYMTRKKDVTYRLIFRYPDTEAAMREAARKKAEKDRLMGQYPIDPSVPAPKERAAHAGAVNQNSAGHDPAVSGSSSAALVTAPQSAPAAEQYNWLYTMNFGDNPASRDIAPSAVYDDGRFTVIRLPQGAEMPTVYQVLPGDGESIVKTHVDNENNALIVEKVCRELRLRNGMAVVGIYNEGFGRIVRTTPSGTSVPGMKRNWTPQADTE